MLGGTAALLAVAGVGISLIETGLDISDVIPAGTYQGDWIEQRFKYFDFFNIEIITEEADYAAAATQRQLLALRAELVGLTNEDGSSYIVQPAPAFWLEEFTNCKAPVGLLPLLAASLCSAPAAGAQGWGRRRRTAERSASTLRV